ncbi:MAG: hypothetical protein HFG34_04735 [Eubacterium sp.]|nr:hypothetical protein [Eubacterium sp.]
MERAGDAGRNFGDLHREFKFVGAEKGSLLTKGDGEHGMGRAVKKKK